MSDPLVRFSTHVAAKDGKVWTPRAVGRIADDDLWEAWIEFVSDSGEIIRTPRETEQPNRDALLYWAEGLTVTYLEGALVRALDSERG